MKPQIITAPFCVDLVGRRAVVQDQCWGAAGRRLMDALWTEVRGRGIRTTGINHWVYLLGKELFAGLELAGQADDLDTLEQQHVELTKYVRHVHRGPYSELPRVWQELKEQLAPEGYKPGLPGLEIYGHWNEDPAQLTTTILLSLADPGE